MPQTPPQTDTYNTALDIFDRTHPLRVDVDENLKVVTAPGSTVTITGPVTTTASFATRSDTFTATGNGVTVDASTFIAKCYSMEVKGTNTPATSWTVVLEGSIDGTAFTTLMIHTTSLGDASVLLSGANLYPMLYFRSRVSQLTLGPAANIIVTIVGKG